MDRDRVLSIELIRGAGRTWCGEPEGAAAFRAAEVREAEAVRPGGEVGLLRLAGYTVVGLLTLAACAQPTGDAAPQRTAGSAEDLHSGPADAGGSTTDCTKADKVAIVESGSGDTGHRYSFSPGSLTIQRGGFLAITNKSDEVHALVSKPDAGIVTSVIDLDERQVVQFPVAGRFTVESAAAAHRAVLHVTVSGESGCGVPKPTLTVTDRYSFTPTHLSVVATQNFTVVNKSGAPQTVICTPDPGGNGDHSRLDKGETQILAIDKPGLYTCTSIQHPGVRAAVTVKGK
jgi:plastocyanin